MKSLMKVSKQGITSIASHRWSSTAPLQSTDVTSTTKDLHDTGSSAKENATQTQKTQAQLDEEMRQTMAAMAGDGGDSGVEYEDGKPVAMKRGVRENMFRYI
ncbi:hypothetical protein AMS68_004510 [Peltaster fructicola]|uniref:Uncharacterized protein n=1 Tax=Peltaster fructicola TaxID=286661 RepID=A0A6H0XW69_9PEZI|nr:hypothetical protein AMS68_004510 [Peltaster fructicola]